MWHEVNGGRGRRNSNMRFYFIQKSLATRTGPCVWEGRGLGDWSGNCSHSHVLNKLSEHGTFAARGTVWNVSLKSAHNGR